MIRISMKEYLDLGMTAHDFSVVLTMMEETETVDPTAGMAPMRRPAKRIEELDQDTRAALMRHLVNLGVLCQSIGMPGSGRLAAYLARNPPETNRELQMVIQTVRGELDEKVCLCVPQHLVGYYESDILVSDKVRAAFPLASVEMREAGTALAFGLSTACVIHSMRAAEIGVRALGTALSIQLPHPIEFAEWAVILNGLTGAI